MKTKLLSILTIVLAIVLASCNEDEPSISLSKGEMTLALGEKSVLTAKLSASDSITPVSWTSDRPDIVTIDNSGHLTAVALGSATVSASIADGNKIASCKVTVELVSFVEIPSGTFQMGRFAKSPESEMEFDHGTKHQVTLTKNFKMSKHEVTNAQYCVFLNSNNIGKDGIWSNAQTYKTQPLVMESSLFESDPMFNWNWGINWNSTDNQWVPVSGKENCPVIFVTWFGAKEFAAWIGGDLPTEAQWERACRGTCDTLPFGTGKVLNGSIANICGRYIYNMEKGGEKDLGENMGIYLKTTCPIGSYQPNFYHLYDMHGNVSEWCNDWYAVDYGNAKASDAATDPTGPATGTAHVVRGGAWGSDALSCHSAFRYYYEPESAYPEIGFRVVRN